MSVFPRLRSRLWTWRPGRDHLRNRRIEDVLTRLEPTYWKARWIDSPSGDAFDDVGAFCLFVGHPRTGATLVGELLNSHRSIAISFELAALRYVAAGARRDQLFRLILRADRRFLEHGASWAGYDYRVPGQWQGKHDRLLVIGDKRAGDTTERLASRPDLLDRLGTVAGVPIKLIHMVRDPWDTIPTLMRRGDRSLEDAVAYYVDLCASLPPIRAAGAGLLTVHLEELIADPSGQLSGLAGFLGVEADQEWLTACADRVFPRPSRTRDDITWTDAARDRVTTIISTHPWLSRYRSSAPGTLPR